MSGSKCARAAAVCLLIGAVVAACSGSIAPDAANDVSLLDSTAVEAAMRDAMDSAIDADANAPDGLDVGLDAIDGGARDVIFAEGGDCGTARASCCNGDLCQPGLTCGSLSPTQPTACWPCYNCHGDPTCGCCGANGQTCCLTIGAHLACGPGLQCMSTGTLMGMCVPAM
jgi:hypothetical protein